MDSILLLFALSAGTLLLPVCCAEGVTAVYHENIVVPCNAGAPVPEDLVFIKWKYRKDDGSPGDLLVKQVRSDQATVHATDEYAQRVSLDEKLSLVITGASLRDQRTFTCMMVSATNILEYPVAVSVEKEPSSVHVLDQAEALLRDKLSMVGTCVAAEANPAATITWMKNGAPLVADGRAVLITPSWKVDPASGLSTTSSTLQVAATRADDSSVFSCVSTHPQSQRVLDLEPVPVHYPPENISLLVLSRGPVVEGTNVTLRCHADGNPPPDAFYFLIQGEKILVEGGDTYTLSSVSREAAGQYKCSLAHDEKLEAWQSLAVSYLDLSLSPTGRVVKTVGENLSIKMETNSSGDVTVLWTKDGVKVTEPHFADLSYPDAGVYTCEVSIMGLTRHRSFELLVQGRPVITKLSSHPAQENQQQNQQQVLTCEAAAFPEPNFQWSINSSKEENWYSYGRAISKITVVPRLNLTVTCSASNLLGDAVRSINVSSVSVEGNEERESSDETRLVVGLVVGSLLAAAIAGLVYWLYMKNSRQGSWKIGEKEDEMCEESKKLENSHMV